MEGIADGLGDLKSLIGGNSVPSREAERYIGSVFHFMGNTCHY